MRALVLAPLLVACHPSAAGDDDDLADTTDDATPAPPPIEPPTLSGCDGPTAELFYGVTPDDVIEPGDALPAEGGANGGAHVSMGLTVSAPSPKVAWRIDLFDVETEVLVGGAGAEAQYTYTALSYWSDETCTGYLPNARVCLGDCGNASLKCEFDGHTLRAEAYATEIGGEAGDEPQATVEFVLAGEC